MLMKPKMQTVTSPEIKWQWSHDVTSTWYPKLRHVAWKNTKQKNDVPFNFLQIKVLFPHPYPQSADRTSTLPHLRSGDRSFFFLLSHHLKMWNMSTKRVKHCILVVVSHTKLLAGLDYDRSYLWIVNLSYAREQLVCSLMVKSSWKRSKKESIQCFFGGPLPRHSGSSWLHLPVKTLQNQLSVAYSSVDSICSSAL